MANKKKWKGPGPAEQHDLDVEIGFLEGLTARDGEWVEALKLLGDDYTRRGRVQAGLAVDERLVRLCPEDPHVLYNLACSCSLTEQYDRAFEALDRAVRLGYDDFQWLSQDPDMANLRKHPRFRKLCEKFHGFHS